MRTLKLTSPPLSIKPRTVFLRKSATGRYFIFIDGHTVFELAVYDAEPEISQISGQSLTDDDITYLKAVIKERLP